MYRNWVTISRFCECQQNLIRSFSLPFSGLPKTNRCVSQRFLSSTSYFTRDYHAAFLPFSKNIHGNTNNHFYYQAGRPTSRLFQCATWLCPSFIISRPHRRYSSSAVELEGLTPIHLWCHETSSYGTLNINAPFNMLIRPLNYEKYPEMNRAFVKFFVPATEEDDSEEGSKRSRWLDLYKMKTSFVQGHLTLTGKLPKDILGERLPPITCLVEVPIKFNINVKVDGEANVSVSNMESDNIFIKCQNGKCLLNNIKTGKLDAYSETGPLECLGVLQGNIRIGCGGDGTLKAQRLLGPDIKCRTESGNIDIADVYSEETIITASEKTVLRLGSCHGKTTININSGNINIKSVEGNLEAITQLGDVEVGLTNTKKEVYACSKHGDVIIGLPKPADMDLDLLAAGFSLSKDFTYLLKSVEKTTDHTRLPLMAIEETVGKRGISIITADAKMGILSIKYQDWLSSMLQ